MLDYVLQICVLPYHNAVLIYSVISGLKPPTPPLVSLTRDTCNSLNTWRLLSYHSQEAHTKCGLDLIIIYSFS